MAFEYAAVFMVASLLSYFLTLAARRFAMNRKIIDSPDGLRKIHKKPTPLLGGLGVFAAFLLVTSFYLFFTDELAGNNFYFKNIIGLFAASAIIMIGGYLDDKYDLKPSRQILWPILAVLVVIISGIGVKVVTNPFGGVFRLDAWQWEILWFNGLPYRLTLIADLFTIFWLMGMMYTTKFLDGLDGLVSGIVGIGALVIFFLSTTTQYFQPDTAYLAIILAGVCGGFLVLNWHPAKIFLGEGGSLWMGFMLGVLAIISGGKIATALLVMGIPILDVGWVIVRRAFFEKKSPFKTSDRKHLHFRLLDIGFTQRKAVLFLYLLSFLFGITTLFLQAKHKLVAIGILVAIMFWLAVILVYLYNKKRKPGQI